MHFNQGFPTHPRKHTHPSAHYQKVNYFVKSNNYD
jgi:hypothetical protein